MNYYSEIFFAESRCEGVNPLKEDQMFYVQQGQEALKKALSILTEKEGWKVEITEVQLTNFYIPSSISL